MTHIIRVVERLIRHRAGNVTIEFGFVILFMATLAVGAYDFGNLGYQKIALTSAARAGAQYGVQDQVTAADTTGMVQAARNDAADTGGALNITARQYCSCPGQGEVSCSVLCADDSFSYMYVEVTAEDQIELLFPYPYVTSPQTVTSTNTMRVR